MGTFKKNKINISIAIISLTVFLSFHASAKFLLDEEIDETPAKTTENANSGKTNDANTNDSIKFPKNVAKNIEVLPVPGLIDSVKITWTLSSGSDGVFIVGRTTEIPSNENIALSALSIKVIQPGEVSEAYDKNIPEGKFYYVILSKNKITEKKIELYPNDNYITNPVIITKKAADVTLLPLVENIKVTVVKEGSAAVTWTPLKLENVIYTIYRSTEQLSSIEKFEKAEKAGVVKDADSFYDSQVDKSGKYFYAVTTSDTVRNENKKLIPDSSFTTQSVNINVEKRTSVADIKLSTLKSNEIRIAWTGIPNFEGEYLVYRNESVINTVEKLNKSYLAERVDSILAFYIDKNAVQGANFYAVIAKDKKGTINKELIANQNYNVEGFEIGTPIRLRMIQSKINPDKKTEIIWQYSGDQGNKQFRLYRSEKITDVKNEIKNFFLVDNVDVSKGVYIDTVPADGTFYYYLVPPDFELQSDFVLARGVNYTAQPVIFNLEKKDPLKLRLLSAKKSEADKVLLTWKFSGKDSATAYVLYRSEKILSSISAIDSAFMVDEVDFQSAQYSDEAVPAGQYYYALIPADYKNAAGFKMLKGINYTTVAVKITQPKSITEKTETGVEIEPEIKIPLKAEIVIPKDLNEILKKYFYQNKYDDSIVYLKQYILNSSDPSNNAAARFYIGRSYAAKGSYSEALKYFLSSDVKEYMPEDSKFWQNYCFTKLGR